MGLFFGSSRRDQVHLLSTLQSLDRTSIAGLAAALSWSERKTERVTQEIVASHGSQIAFDTARRIVAVRHATQVTPAPAVVAAPTSAVIATSVSRTSPFGSGIRCTSCGAALVATAQGDSSVCPQCGHLSSRR